MKASPKLSNLQLELLKLFSFEVSEEQVKDIKALLVQYFANQITHDMDALFESEGWDDTKITEWAQAHLRAPYKA